MLVDFDGVLGQNKAFIWSKENELWRTFYRTHVAGHWSKQDVAEFMKCGYYYEIHFDHAREHEAHTFCLEVMARCDKFKAVKLSKLAVNNVKVMVFLGSDKTMKDKMKLLAGQAGFEFARLRLGGEPISENENVTRSKFRQYIESLGAMFAPMLGRRVSARR